MFDLVKAVSSNSQSPSRKEQKCAVFYQTQECLTVIGEALRFEGMDEPAGIQVKDDSLLESLLTTKAEIMFIEILGDPVVQAEKIRGVVAPGTRVVLIGHLDKISIIRVLVSLGFYYLLWPMSRADICGFLGSLKNDLHKKGASRLERKARRIGVVSLKGGSGCTLVASELAFGLANESHQQIILVDHSYTGSNMHIMLGKKDLQKHSLNERGSENQSLGSMLDYVGAHSQLTRINDAINFLGFEADSGNGDDMREYCHGLLDTLSRDANFIIEDFSASANFYPDPKWLCPLMDCVVLVVAPTLSGLHQTHAFLEKFRQENSERANETRLILLMNQSYQSVSASQETIEQFLGHKIDIHMPHQKNCEEIVTGGQRFIDARTNLTQPFLDLSRLILGKPLPQRSWFARLVARA